MQKYCSKCNTQAAPNEIFCYKCGCRLSEYTAFNNTNNTTPINTQQSANNAMPANPNNTAFQMYPGNMQNMTQNTQPVNQSEGYPNFRPVVYPQAVQNATGQAFVATHNASQGKSRKNSLFIALGAVVCGLLLIMIIVAIFAVSKKDNNNYPSENIIDNNYSEDLIDSGVDVPVGKRTVMIYIVGSDLESSSGAATSDIKEMMQSGFNSDNVNVLIYTGGASKWFTDEISADGNSIFELDDSGLVELESYPCENMGQSETLTSFLDFGVENYPADEYGLILWNHGAGPIFGYGADEIHPGDMLLLPELMAALSASVFGNDRKLEFLGFDACLMGSIETAWCVKDYAEYFIASQEIEPGCGWDYSFLNKLDRCATGEDVGRVIIDSYFSECENIFDIVPHLRCDLTLSCVDLSYVDDVETAINNLFKNVNTNILNGYFAKASRCRYQTKAFGKFATSFDYDLIDLSHLVSLLSSDYGSYTKELNTALDEFICYSKSNVDQANGISIYHPYDNKDYMEQCIEVFDSLGFATQYSKYIATFADILNNGDVSSDRWNNFSKNGGTAEKQGNANNLKMQLTPEQVENFSGAEYYIFEAIDASKSLSGAPEYMHVFSGHDVTLSDKGVLSATYDGKAVFGVNRKTGVVSASPLTMFQVYDGTDNLKYYFPCVFIDFGEDLYSLWNFANVNWMMEIRDGEPVLLGAYSDENNDNTAIPDKQLIDYTDYDVYEFGSNCYKIERDEFNNIEFVLVTDGVFVQEFSKEDGFSIECREIENKDSYYAVFVVEDIHGNKYTSDLIPLS